MNKDLEFNNNNNQKLDDSTHLSADYDSVFLYNQLRITTYGILKMHLNVFDNSFKIPSPRALHCVLFSFYTVCPKSSDPFYIVTYYIKWVTSSWTDGICYMFCEH